MTLELDLNELLKHGTELRIESNKPSGEKYPHLYGTQKIQLAAVTTVWHLVEQADGTWAKDN